MIMKIFGLLKTQCQLFDTTRNNITITNWERLFRDNGRRYKKTKIRWNYWNIYTVIRIYVSDFDKLLLNTKKLNKKRK